MATGDKLVNLDELKLVYDKLHVSSVQVQIPTGQWSGSSTRTYTVNATNVTADTIIDWAMDSSINYLKADLTVTPGSGTIQFSTTAIPAGTINVTLFFPGVNGEVVIQTLADVYSKSQVDQKIAQSTAKTEFTGTLSLAAGVTLTNFSARKVAGIVYIRGVVQKTLTLGGWNELFTLPEGYRPKEDFYTCLLNATTDKAIEARITATGVAYVYPVSDTASASATNIAFSLTFIQ